eukprot:TRINITY_DN17553_c0_g1_i3.p1 TRINITY_DN17553_c0_g1~~TRINITY_DN17553_c0_g1_i3.p1  ORF type:complete len:230 (-),score=33.65 TRINITY_DN17553_c0_g1_i3:29-718(-)
MRAMRSELRGRKLEFPEGVLPEWIDHNGHMNVSSVPARSVFTGRQVMAYQVLLQYAGHQFLCQLKLNSEALRGSTDRRGTMVLQNNTRHVSELLLGERFVVEFSLIDYSERMCHFGMAMSSEAHKVVATCEKLVICVDLNGRGATRWPREQLELLAHEFDQHAEQPVPSWAGDGGRAVSYTHLRAHETPEHLVCRLLLEKKKKYINVHERQRHGIYKEKYTQDVIQCMT